ncbi:3-oxoadipate enol-lactone hydrolase [Microtetraspora sp. NBRC 13810]|uniref:alpha/beta fold hydrolase n=1 Tax=Microtetraspora sp. NBRC 13810 TaxID=3030990 RepID=UPI0024A439CE|nr:alpha/beta hydrolase [Microtetraspora sp. NBRC 13810]GLW07428.1 3-oxoadipate enol-lactone hydrolase [Microtetraspora sp. NBRC 13810]
MSTRVLPEPTFARTRLGSGPALVVAHGASSSFEGTWGPILEGLTAHHTVVGIDYPGSGVTPRSETPLSLDDLADQMVAAAVAEGLDTFALAGFSLGGPVAIRAAVRHPERVSALVLTAAFAHPDNNLALIGSVWKQLAESGDRELLAEFLLPVALGSRALEALPADRLRATLGYTAASSADGTPEQVALVIRADVRDDLAKIHVPTLVISTTADRTVAPTLHHQLAEQITGAQLAEIDAGHVVGLERPEEWLRLITGFLNRQDHSA